MKVLHQKVGSFQLVVLLGLTTFFSLAEGFKQELWLYDANDISLHITSHAADLSDHSAFLAKAARYCTKGVWNVYWTADFQLSKYRIGTMDSSSLECDSFFEAGEGSDFGSVRHWASSDTTVSSISLYQGRNFAKQEILVTSQSHTKIPHSVFSLTTTGTSDWTLYEGQNLNGKSVCFKGPAPGNYFSFKMDITTLGLDTIGSVSKGC